MNASPMLETLVSSGIGIGRMSPIGPAMQEELGVELGRQQDVEAGVEVAGAHADRLERRWPDGHPATVDDDRDAVRRGSHGDRQQARVAPVGPQPGDQQAERGGVERQPKLLGDVDAVGDGDLGADAQREGEEDQPDPAQSDVDQPADLAAGEQAGDKPGQDAKNNHGLTAPQDAVRRRRSLMPTRSR